MRSISGSKGTWSFGVGALLSVLCPILVLAQPVEHATELGAAAGVTALIVLSAAFVSFLKNERREQVGADSHST